PKSKRDVRSCRRPSRRHWPGDLERGDPLGSVAAGKRHLLLETTILEWKRGHHGRWDAGWDMQRLGLNGVRKRDCQRSDGWSRRPLWDLPHTGFMRLVHTRSLVVH